MTRKSPDSGRKAKRFPVTDYWEELRGKSEADLGPDALGPDHSHRFEVIAMLIERGHGLPQSAFIARAQIEALVEPVGGADPEALVDRLFEIAGRHLRPLHRRIFGSDPKSTAEQLRAVAKAAAALEDALDALPILTQHFLQDAHRNMASNGTTHELDIAALDLGVGDLGRIAQLSSWEVSREANAPTKVLRRQTLCDALTAIETATSIKVTNRWSRHGEKDYAFTGSAGALLRDFMKLLEPRTSESTLVKLMLEVRKSRS